MSSESGARPQTGGEQGRGLLEETLEAALARYRREHAGYLRAADAVASRCLGLAAEAEIPVSVQWRVKRPERARAKLERLVRAGAAGPGEGALDALGDVVGVRVSTYVEADRERIVAAIDGAFDDVEVELKDRPGSFYRATHCQLRLSRASVPELDPELTGLACEVQVCSLLAQVWNEIEHGLVYSSDGAASAEQQAALHALGRLTEAGDAVVSVLLAKGRRAGR